MKIHIEIEVPSNWASRMDMQSFIEQEIKADRWSWNSDLKHRENMLACSVRDAQSILTAALANVNLPDAQSTALDNLTRDAVEQGLYEDKPTFTNRQ